MLLLCFFLHQYNWLPRYNWNIVESGFKHHNSNPNAEFTSSWSLLEHLHIGHYNILTLQFLKTSLSGFDFYQLQYRLSTCGYTEGIYSWEMYSCFIITHDMHDPMFQIRNILICWKLEQYFYLLLTWGMVYSINQWQQQQWYPNWKIQRSTQIFYFVPSPFDFYWNNLVCLSSKIVPLIAKYRKVQLRVWLGLSRILMTKLLLLSVYLDRWTANYLSNWQMEKSPGREPYMFIKWLCWYWWWIHNILSYSVLCENWKLVLNS